MLAESDHHCLIFEIFSGTKWKNSVDHLVNVAGLAAVGLLEELDDVTNFAPAMVCN